MLTSNNSIQTDSIKNQNQETPELNVGLNKISLSDIRSIRIDSSKLEKPKVYKPPVKIKPVIPLSDSTEHPEFKSLTGKYSFPEDNIESPVWYNEYQPVSESNIKHIQKVAVPEQKVITEKIVIPETITEVTISKNTEQQKGFTNTEWMLGVIILCLIIFGWIRVGFGKFINTVVQASYNYHAAKRMQEEPNALRKRVFHFMNTLFFLVLPLFIAQWLNYNNIEIWKLSGFWLYVISFTFCLIIYSAKSIFLVLLDFLFLGKGAFINYNSTVFIYNKILSICLLPIVSALPFIPQQAVPLAFNIGIFLFAFFYLMRIFRGMLFSIRNRVSLFYLFLYLCALEILPILVLFKAISELT